MSDSFTTDEVAIGGLIRRLADTETRDRDPANVAQAVVSRAEPRQLQQIQAPAVAALIALVVVGAVVVGGALNQLGSSPGTAQVRGLRYGVAVARSMDLSQAQLTPFGEAVQNTGGVATVGTTAYRVDQLDPEQVLVMEVMPGEHDDSGSIGSHLLLVRGDGFSLLCDYFAENDPLAPTDCR